MFNLSVSLRMKSCKKLVLDFKKVEKQKPEFWGKKWALITNNEVWNVVVLDNYIENNFYQT